MEFTTPIYKTKTKSHIACPALQKLLTVPKGFKNLLSFPGYQDLVLQEALC